MIRPHEQMVESEMKFIGWNGSLNKHGFAIDSFDFSNRGFYERRVGTPLVWSYRLLGGF